jgi:hypothetical protein
MVTPTTAAARRRPTTASVRCRTDAARSATDADDRSGGASVLLRTEQGADMTVPRKPAAPSTAKAATGIGGFDQVARGGLPAGRASLVVGDLDLCALPDAAARRREIHRLNEWLLARGFTALITPKARDDGHDTADERPHHFMPFMADCVVILGHVVVAVVRARGRTDARESSERVSSGIERLDRMRGADAPG